jgi:hypothetical protein
VRLIPLITALAALGFTTFAAAQAPPQVPASFYGSATIDGEAPPPGTEVRGFIDGRDCTQKDAAGTYEAGAVGAYIISVMHESQASGCGREGATVTFRVGGRDAAQTATWSMGLHQLDLNAGSGEPHPLPSNVPTRGPQPGFSGTASRGTPTPAPPGFDVNDDPGGDDGGLGIAGFALVALAGLAVVGAAAAWALRTRRRPSPDDTQSPPAD